MRPWRILAMLSALTPAEVLRRDELAEAATQTGSRQTEGVTQEGSSTGRWLSRSKVVGRGVGKSASKSLRPRLADLGEVSDPMLPRKPLAVSISAARTPNRRRWSGREYLGDRVNCGKELGKLSP